ncbi:MAG: LUD domain-containing protein [Bacillota bacterium]|nr:LUD domain-containing protein [Bacillota bacterium]
MNETNTARETILNRIRRSNADLPTSDYASLERAYQQTACMGREAVWKTFIERLHEYDARVTAATPDTLPSALAEVLLRNHQKSAVVADRFPQKLLPEGFRWQPEADATAEELNLAEGAICGCEVAIAHTGTIVIVGARRLTLLPDRLLCVVYDHQIVETVPEAFARLQPLAMEPLTFVSGPSATADIEMTRIRGVHGPRFLDVVFVSETWSQVCKK